MYAALSQYTEYSFVPVVKAFLTADSAGRPHAPVACTLLAYTVCGTKVPHLYHHDPFRPHPWLQAPRHRAGCLTLASPGCAGRRARGGERRRELQPGGAAEEDHRAGARALPVPESHGDPVRGAGPPPRHRPRRRHPPRHQSHRPRGARAGPQGRITALACSVICGCGRESKKGGKLACRGRVARLELTRRVLTVLWWCVVLWGAAAGRHLLEQRAVHRAEPVGQGHPARFATDRDALPQHGPRGGKPPSSARSVPTQYTIQSSIQPRPHAPGFHSRH
jgi:hypothetical protein